MAEDSSRQNNYYNPIELNNLIRLLCTQNTMWTRNYIVSYISVNDDTIVVENRLYENARDFRNVFIIYYKSEISDVLESLLRKYTNYMIETLKFLQKKVEGLEQAEENWISTGIELAEFLSNINTFWQLNQIQNMILDHIEMTMIQMKQRIRREYALEIYQYDFIEYHSLMIADYISQGIVAMFA